MGKLRASLLGIAAALALAGCGATSGSHGQPSGLSDYGRILWNFEALADDHFGTSTPSLCTLSSSLEAPYLNYTPAACKLAPSGAQVVPYKPAFGDAHGSHFTLTDRPPNLALDLEPIKLAGRYVACGTAKTWLELSPTAGWICVTYDGTSVSPT
jgi:hypothetical protein